MRARLIVLLAVVLAASAAGLLSYERVSQQMAVIQACEALQREDWATALAATAGRVGADDTGRAAAECRCLALLATGEGAQCGELLEGVLAEPESDGWAPNPTLSVHLIQTLRDRGRALEAAELARRAGKLYPHEPDLFYLELVTRGSVEDEDKLLREMERRLPDAGPPAARMRASLATRHLLRGDPARALAVLGEAPPPRAGPAAGAWFESRGMAHAVADDLRGVQRTYEEWRRGGGNPNELRARYALTLSIAGLRDPRRDAIERLRRALASGDGLEPELREALTIRLILTLVNSDRLDEALAAYDRGRERFELVGLSREEIERAATHRELAEAPAAQRVSRSSELANVSPNSSRLQCLAPKRARCSV